MGPSKRTVFCHFKRSTIKRIKFFLFFTDQRGRTPLHFAAQHGQLPVCELIIANVENKNPMDREGHTPLYYAAKHGQMTVCQLIINYIEDKNPINSSRRTPLHYAAQNGHLSICQLIMKNLIDPNPKGNFVLMILENEISVLCNSKNSCFKTDSLS